MNYPDIYDVGEAAEELVGFVKAGTIKDNVPAALKDAWVLAGYGLSLVAGDSGECCEANLLKAFPCSTHEELDAAVHGLKGLSSGNLKAVPLPQILAYVTAVLSAVMPFLPAKYQPIVAAFLAALSAVPA